jgi:hypothetical protein
MFKRLWQRAHDWAEALSMDDPRGGYLLGLERRLARLERDLEDIRLVPATTTTSSPDDRVRHSKS